MQEWVPNFIGGAISRSDCWDREYYYLTMLTFFQPWRTRKDLKSEDQSWDNDFTSQMFNTRQLEVMKYFNVRYESLDARDDYPAQIKKMQIWLFFPTGIYMMVWILILMIITPLKVMTLYVILTMSFKILLDLKLQSTTETCYILTNNAGCRMVWQKS